MTYLQPSSKLTLKRKELLDRKKLKIREKSKSGKIVSNVKKMSA
jgi:hypothetical protein